MAYKTTKIKSGMTLPKLAEQYGTTPAAILQANKIPKLSAGMVVKIPPPPKPAGWGDGGFTPTQYQPNQYSQPIGPVQPQVLVGGQWQNFNRQYQQPIGPNQPQYGPFQPAPLTQGSFVSGNGSVNQQISPQQAYMQQFPSQGTVNIQQPVGINAADRNSYMTTQATTTTTGAIQQRPPSGVYDPNAADAQDWINYWNKLPVGTPKSNVYIPTKSEVWLMKGQARRRRKEQEEQDNNNYSTQNYTPPQKQEQPTGNASNQNVTWRIG